MPEKAARPKRVTHNDHLDVLKRQRRDFAVQPLAFDSERWSRRLVSTNLKPQGKMDEEAKEKRLIRDASKGIKGVEFPAEELAKIIRGWMAQDE